MTDLCLTCKKYIMKANDNMAKETKKRHLVTLDLEDVPKIKRIAEKENRSVSNLLAWIITEYIKNYDKPSQAKETVNNNKSEKVTTVITNNNKSKSQKEPKHKYGQYDNVLLSDVEYEKLKAEFPCDYEIRIERLSEYMASTGKSYKSHLATIRCWARKDGNRYNEPQSQPPSTAQQPPLTAQETHDLFQKPQNPAQEDESISVDVLMEKLQNYRKEEKQWLA